MADSLVSVAQELTLPYYEAALPAHDRYHASRVCNLAGRLAHQWVQPVDIDTLSAAAWFHDIGRPLERTSEIDDHGEWAAMEAKRLLESEDISSDQIDAIQYCLRTHSIRASSPEPKTPEAKLLFDADKLDASGAVGIVRLACIIGERSGRTGKKYASVHDTAVPEEASSDQPDIALLRDWARERLDLLHTPPAQQLGTSRWEYMIDFFERFSDEIALKR